MCIILTLESPESEASYVEIAFLPRYEPIVNDTWKGSATFETYSYKYDKPRRILPTDACRGW